MNERKETLMGRGHEETKLGRDFHFLLLIVPWEQHEASLGVNLLIYKMANINISWCLLLGLLSPLPVRGCAVLIMRDSFSKPSIKCS